MKMHVTAGLGARTEATVPGLIARAQELETLGFAGMWLPNAFSFDAITALAVAGAKTSSIEIGTAVVPTFPRHPVVMAQQAMTAQSGMDGRFTLGIGLSHRVMMEDALGIPFERPAAHMREYLSVLMPLLNGQSVSFHGETYNVEAAVMPVGGPRVPVLVAALGPAMLKLAGSMADGTITSWVGPKTLAGHIVPTLRAAADEAGRPAPRIAVGLPVVLTSDPESARALIAVNAANYNTLPSYQAMFAREGVSGPQDIAIAGDENAIDAALRNIEEAGATDFLVQFTSVGPGSVQRTLEYVASKLR